MEQTKYWLWLVQAFGAGNHRLWEVLGNFVNPEQAYLALSSESADIALTPAEKQSISTTHISQSESVITYCGKKEIRIITYEDGEYPNRLKGIYNPPAVLFCMGSLDFVDDDVAITVVGTRKPSDYSIKVAKKISSDLVKVGVTIVSGFALGIDSMAHRSALELDGRTIAVLGCGIDYDYPRENSRVKEIIARRGAVISEFFPGTRPDGRNFPIRNRILSALSLGTLVIEADKKSGSLITAELALQQGRDVFCIPPADLFDSRYSGVVRLIRDGAVPVFSYLDIIYEYYENFSHKLNSINSDDIYSDKEDSVLFEEKIIGQASAAEEKAPPEEKKPEPPKQVDYSDLSGEQTQIMRLFETCESISVDEIAAATDFDVSEILTTLTELELFGRIKALAGNRYSL